MSSSVSIRDPDLIVLPILSIRDFVPLIIDIKTIDGSRGVASITGGRLIFQCLINPVYFFENYFVSIYYLLFIRNRIHDTVSST